MNKNTNTNNDNNINNKSQQITEVIGSRSIRNFFATLVNNWMKRLKEKDLIIFIKIFPESLLLQLNFLLAFQKFLLFFGNSGATNPIYCPIIKVVISFC